MTWRTDKHHLIGKVRSLLTRIWARVEVYDSPPHSLEELVGLLREADTLANPWEKPLIRGWITGLNKIIKEERDNG